MQTIDSPTKIPKEHQILHINFNQDQGFPFFFLLFFFSYSFLLGCFALATEKGIKVFNTYPYKMTIERGNLFMKNQCQFFEKI